MDPPESVTSMTIPFWKMHGAGNDFIMVDDRDEIFPLTDIAWLQRTAARRTGIGCDGFIVLQHSRSADVRMRIINSDGSEAEMCGNGARCAARLALELGITDEAVTLETGAGPLRALVLDGGTRVRLDMAEPQDWRMDLQLDLDGAAVVCGHVNTGVPHAVIRVDAVADVDIRTRGREIRNHVLFTPAGANANFIETTGPRNLKVRTYERGVEDETLACGTGLTAAALVAGRRGWVEPPVAVACASGDVQDVDFTLIGDGARDVTLTGPVAHVFRGELEY